MPHSRNWRWNSADRLLGRLARVLPGLDRVVLRRQAEGVVAHRVQHAVAVAGAGSGPRRRRPSRSSGGRCAARPTGRAASRARTTWAARRARSTPPRCARRPRRAATWARSSWGRSGPCLDSQGYSRARWLRWPSTTPARAASRCCWSTAGPRRGASGERNVGPLAEAGFEVIVPDLRGFGDSRSPATTATTRPRTPATWRAGARRARATSGSRLRRRPRRRGGPGPVAALRGARRPARASSTRSRRVLPDGPRAIPREVRMAADYFIRQPRTPTGWPPSSTPPSGAAATWRVLRLALLGGARARSSARTWTS